MRIACQTYTWEMLGDAWHGSVDQILKAISSAGYEGIEITNHMIGKYAHEPAAFIEALGMHDLQLAAFAYATTGFTDPACWEEDWRGAWQALRFVERFPGTKLCLGGAASPSREDARAKLDRAIVFYNEVGKLGTGMGISVNVHPHSHFGSLLETAEEYQYLLERLDPCYVSLGPDTGHIVRGGQDLLTCLRTYLPRITHLHLKDANANREWVGLGDGLCDFPGVLELLQASGYDGWVVAEEESADARVDGIAAIRKNREYLRGLEERAMVGD